MAGIVDILLRVRSDQREAATGLRQVGDEAQTAERKVDSLSTRVQRLRGALAGLASRAAIGGGIGGAAINIAGNQLDQLTGADAKIGRAQGNVQFAGSAKELADAFWSTANARASSFGEAGGIGGFFRNPAVDIGRRLTRGSHPGVSPSQEREYIEYFRDIARSDPARAAALLGIPDLGKVEYLRPRLQAELARAAAGRAYTAGLEPAVTNINIHTGVGDPNAIGREVRAALDRRDRNNGRYVTTWTRR